ncbi:hypothetical protein LH51_16575 [Nitrincola sp. A-D6]|uniref:hypothetical protein n=1 Tax=Nitrincola sp. A-D6 TaxID=1545442 RepID=UPI00051FCAFE|nr:hypothetical protein [Nitrincola sp. A-D6]KGK41214.1 hypothetical protein LH51_16575 [Nitrincola sp. A-D6]
MRLITEVGIQDKIIKALQEAKVRNLKVKEIVLSRDEWDELRNVGSRQLVAKAHFAPPLGSVGIWNGYPITLEEDLEY